LKPSNVPALKQMTFVEQETTSAGPVTTLDVRVTTRDGPVMMCDVPNMKPGNVPLTSSVREMIRSVELMTAVGDLMTHSGLMMTCVGLTMTRLSRMNFQLSKRNLSLLPNVDISDIIGNGYGKPSTECA
jgi:hypothetical protein